MLEKHWENVYQTKDPEKVSWFRPHLETSLALVERATGGNHSAAIIDVGGGASTLVDDLVGRGYENVTILDIAQSALDLAQARLVAAAKVVHWLNADVVKAVLPAQSFDVWHDRAVFHFLTSPEDRKRYASNVTRSVRAGGHVIVSTFGPEGPAKCSGLDVMRYDAASLHAEFGAAFKLLESSVEMHDTPFGTTQQFVYCHLVLEP
jgi:2-polyprenyl-3-methyl-5-hydroxy-6-metoxy-1,4-benzoquinol methylase